MDPRDLFVGGLAIVMGVSLIVVAALGSEAPFRLPKLRWLESQIGRGPSRATLAAIGLGLVVLGALIAAGVSPSGD
jgi:hypothetical protein